MIFKTFNSDIDNMSSRWGMFGKSFSDIGDTITTKWKQVTDYIAITNDATISGMMSAWKGTSPVQFLSDDSVVNIISDYNKALDKGAEATAKFFEAGTGNDFMNGWLKQLKGAPATMDDYKAAVAKAELAQNGLTASMVASKVAALALNVAVSMGVSIAISALIKLVDNLVHANEKAIKKSEELRDKYNDFKETNASNVKTLNDLKDEFEELSDGVSQYGDNISLTTEQYARYQEIVQQIVGMSPSLAEGYDTENGYIADKNKLLERAIELQEIEYRNELRKRTNLTGDLKTSMEGHIAEYRKSLDDGKSNTSFSNALWEVFNTKNRDNYDSHSMARDIMESLGVKDIDKEIEKYINEYGYWQNDKFWNDYCDQIANNLDAVTNSLTAEEVGLDDTIFNQNIEKLESYAEQYNDMKDSVASANESIQTDLEYIAEYADGYSDLSKEQQKFVADYLKGFNISDISSENYWGFLEYDENKMSSVKSQIKKFVEELSHDDSTKQALTDLYAPPSDNETIEEYKNRIDSALEVIRKYCEANGIEIPVGISDVEDSATSLESSYKQTIENAKEKYGEDLTPFFKENSINTQEEIDKWREIAQSCNTATEAKKKYLEADTSQETPILFEDLFNNDSIDSTKQKLLDLATSGELSAETITSTEDYKALLDELGISADEFVNKISEFNIQYNEDNYNSLIDLLSRVRKGEILSADEATTLIATYDSLAGELVKTGDGYSFNESAIISLTNKYAETSNLAISNEVKKTNAAIEGVKERINAYGIEMEALKTIQKIYEDTGSKIEVMNWLKDNGYSMFMASNYLDIANEYSELEKKSESLKGKMLEQIETTTSAAKSTETALDRITKKYKELTDVIGSNVNLILSQIKLLEAQGKEVGEAYYTELVDQSSAKIAVLTEQFNELRQQFLNTPKGTDEWLELNSSILEVQNSIIEAKTSMAEYQKTLDNMKWERAENKFDSLSDIISSNTDLLKAQMDLLEKQGSKVGKGFYTEMISESQKQLELLNDRYQTLMQQILTVDEGSDDWLELNKSIFDVQKSIIQAKTNIEDYQNSIDQLHWDTLDEIADAINGISDEAGNIAELLDLDTVLDENGNLTKDAITALGMYGEQLESAQYLINKYSKEIEYLNGEYIKGTITVEEYNEKMKDLNDKQWESVDAYNAAKKAIIELRKKGIDKEIEALEELYDARKKAWEQEKDQHDWEKTVSENETNINKLKQQIEELQNDNSLAGIKKRKELEDELKDLESDWEDTLYDHVYDERQDQLDKELEDKKKALEKTLDDEEKLVADSIDLVNKNCSTVLDNLAELSKKYGIQISSSITEGFKGGENALSSYSTRFSEAHSGFTSQLAMMEQKVYAVQTQADNTALSILAMFNSTNGTLDEQLATTNSKINNLHIDADSAATSIVNMFKSTNGTLGEQLSKTREAIQAIIDKANEAANAVRNAGMATPTTTTTTASNSTNSTNPSLGDMAHDTSGTTLPNAGTWKNANQDIAKDKAEAANTAKKAIDKIVQVEEKKKNQGSSKLTVGGSSKSKFTTISKGYASGTQSATKGLHPIYEDGVEIIEKDGCLIYPIGAFDGGEKVFNNEQTQRLWELSQNPDVMEKFRQELLNIRPCIDFKFGNTAPVTKTNQNVNVQQHFDALVKVEGDMTPDVLAQIRSDRKIKDEIGNVAMQKFVDSYNTRGFRI